MKELQRKQKAKQRLYSNPVLVGLGIVTLLLVRGVYGVLIKAHTSAQGVGTLTTQVAALSQKELQLKDDVARLKTDAGIDEEIKQKFNVSADGEKVAIVVDNQGTTTASSTAPESWYKRAWSAIISPL